jgi:hypothetical protein
VGFLAPERQHWIIEPLLEAGLDSGQITDLVFRLGFDAVVGDGCAGDVAGHVRDHSPEVQAAWHRAVVRMLAAHESGTS